METGTDKREICFTPKIIFAVNYAAHCVILPVNSVNLVTVPVENHRQIFPEELFAHAGQSAIDSTGEAVEDVTVYVSGAVSKCLAEATKTYTSSVEDDAYSFKFSTVPGFSNADETFNHGDKVKIYCPTEKT